MQGGGTRLFAGSWQLSEVVSVFHAGIPERAHRHGCIGDEDVEYHSDHDSDSFDPWGDYSYPGDTEVQAILNPQNHLPDPEPASDSLSDGHSGDDSVMGPRAPLSYLPPDSSRDTESISV